MSSLELGLAVAAGAMAVSTAYLLKVAVNAADRRTTGLALFLLAMMAEMFVAADVYLLAPGIRSLIDGLIVSGALMAATAAGLFAGLTRRAAATPSSRGAGTIAAALALLLLNEAMMAWTFESILGGAPVPGGATGVASLLLSPWFVFTMAAEMAWSTALLWRRLPGPLRVLLLLETSTMALAPPALPVADWAVASAGAGSVAMIAAIVYELDYLYRQRSVPRALAAYFLALLAAFAAMMVGLFLWWQYGDPLLFAGSLVGEMAVFLSAIADPDRFRGAGDFRWLERPHAAFALLALIFVGELFMGAVLDVALAPATYAGAIPSLPVAGAPLVLLGNAVSNGFWFFATITASTWFLAMMGAEMGVLVVAKMRESHHLENRIRLGLMLGCYAAFAVFYPSVYFALVAPNAPSPALVPVLGWSMGIGSYPLAVGVFGTLAATYAVTGVLCALFGRRVVCSVFCTAPTMYQGTALDATKAFNRTGPIGRKYQSSRLSRAYGVTTGVVMGSLVVTSFLSYFDTTGQLNVTIGGSDPTVFLFVLYFSVLWYALFVTIPYAGNYNCVTMGWCYTGTVAAAFQKVGFFKLKVRSKETCRACPTLDCAKGCPIALVDMPGHFRTTGEFRSSKCCGVGDCVEACPYDNLYISDVRHWLRRRFGLPETRAPRGVRLPMARAAPPVSAAPIGVGARTAAPAVAHAASPQH